MISLPSGGKEELSADLTGYIPGLVPPGSMDYLFIELILRGKQEGCRRFDMRVAPLAGLENKGRRGFRNGQGAGRGLCAAEAIIFLAAGEAEWFTEAL